MKNRLLNKSTYVFKQKSGKKQAQTLAALIQYDFAAT